MKILHVSTHDFGGAFVAAYRLHLMLVYNGIDSSFMVLHKTGNQPDIKVFSQPRQSFFFRKLFRLLGFNPVMDANKALRQENRVEAFTSPNTIYDLGGSKILRDFDVIHLHWVANFIDIPTFFKRIKKPVVWTFHDENPFLGGVHYSEDYLHAGSVIREIDQQLRQVKHKAIMGMRRPLVIICPSKWLYNKAKDSFFGHLKIKWIPYIIDRNKFTDIDQHSARERLNKGSSKILFSIVATYLKNYRKGFDIFLDLISKNNIDSRVEFLVVGDFFAPFDPEKYKNVSFLGKINDLDSLLNVYAASDALIIPSRQDNLPNVMIESLAMGCPVLGFNVGGIGDTIDDGFNGFLSSEISAQGLLSLIERFIAVGFKLQRAKIRQDAITRFASTSIVDEVTLTYRDSINITRV